MGTKTAVSCANIFWTQSLSKTVFEPDIVTFTDKANLHHPTIKFATEIRWDNTFRHSCIQRHKIQRKSYPRCKDYGNLPAHISPFVSHWFVKGTLDGQRLPTQFERKIAIKNKWNSQKLKSALNQNSEEEKEMLPSVTQYQPLVSTMKEALMEKWNLIQNQPLLKNHPLFPTRKENHGKEHAC